MTIKQHLARVRGRTGSLAEREREDAIEEPSSDRSARRELPDNTLDGVPDLRTELNASLRALIRGDEEPRSVIHAMLLRDNEPRTVESLAADLGWDSAEVEWSLEVLVDEEWALEFEENGLRKFVLYVPFVEGDEARPFLPAS